MTRAPTLTFFGAVGTVTGSKYLLEANGRRTPIDYGAFQGKEALRRRNWRSLPAYAEGVRSSSEMDDTALGVQENTS